MHPLFWGGFSRKALWMLLWLHVIQNITASKQFFTIWNLFDANYFIVINVNPGSNIVSLFVNRFDSNPAKHTFSSKWNVFVIRESHDCQWLFVVKDQHMWWDRILTHSLLQTFVSPWTPIKLTHNIFFWWVRFVVQVFTFLFYFASLCFISPLFPLYLGFLNNK